MIQHQPQRLPMEVPAREDFFAFRKDEWVVGHTVHLDAKRVAHVIQRARHADALRETLTFAPGVAARGGQLLPSLPGAGHNQDGFFYALLGKG